MCFYFSVLILNMFLCENHVFYYFFLIEPKVSLDLNYSSYFACSSLCVTLSLIFYII